MSESYRTPTEEEIKLLINNVKLNSQKTLKVRLDLHTIKDCETEISNMNNINPEIINNNMCITIHAIKNIHMMRIEELTRIEYVSNNVKYFIEKYFETIQNTPKFKLKKRAPKNLSENVIVHVKEYYKSDEIFVTEYEVRVLKKKLNKLIHPAYSKYLHEVKNVPISTTLPSTQTTKKELTSSRNSKVSITQSEKCPIEEEISKSKSASKQIDDLLEKKIKPYRMCLKMMRFKNMS
ncbi:hypothetical protein A3Q56_01281 [Intoshia linei]|uniref:Uncharacterized protein n=1 Tax=Intoshia linei TaxID=1819745 RepID=A0A177BBC9_9BILA|nr:hypothetical protein A3Q56_01281 [Intoshia linei]